MGCVPSYFAVLIDEKRVMAQGKKKALDYQALGSAKMTTESLLEKLDDTIQACDEEMVKQKSISRGIPSHDKEKMKSVFTKWHLARVNRKMAFTLKDTLSTNMSKIEARYLAISVLKYSADMSSILSTKAQTGDIDRMMEDALEKMNDGFDVDSLIKEHTFNLELLSNKDKDEVGEFDTSMFDTEAYREFVMEDIPAVPKTEPLLSSAYPRNKKQDSGKTLEEGIKSLKTVHTSSRSLTIASVD